MAQMLLPWFHIYSRWHVVNHLLDLAPLAPIQSHPGMKHILSHHPSYLPDWRSWEKDILKTCKMKPDTTCLIWHIKVIKILCITICRFKTIQRYNWKYLESMNCLRLFHLRSWGGAEWKIPRAPPYMFLFFRRPPPTYFSGTPLHVFLGRSPHIFQFFREPPSHILIFSQNPPPQIFLFFVHSAPPQDLKWNSPCKEQMTFLPPRLAGGGGNIIVCLSICEAL